MSLRKITTLLLLVAFALTSVPVQAANLSDENETPPNVIVDAGTSANGANRDVVPVNIVIETTAGEIIFQKFGAGSGTYTVSDNGQLMNTVTTTSDDPRLVILTPPTGTTFVGLDGYVSNVTSGTLNNAAADEKVFVNIENITDDSDLPSNGTSDSAVLAKILTEDGPASTFGTVVPAGSIVIYFLTNSLTDQSTGAIDVKLENIGLAAEPGSTLTGDLSVTYDAPSAPLDPAISLTDGSQLVIATTDADPNGQIEVELDATEPDAESNSVLADLLSASNNTVKVSTNYITSTSADGTNQTTLYVDTDALLIQAGETPASTSMTPVYYDTPFNTSAFLSSTRNGGNVTQLNAALTSTTAFPNSANALITVTYSLLPLTGNGSTDATLVVDAASVSLVDQGTTDGFLGALKVPVLDANGAAVTDANFGVGVLYQGANATTALRINDFDSLDDTVTDVTSVSTAVGFDFTNVPSSTKVPVASASAAAFVNSNGNLASGVFPGVTVAQADAITTTPRVVQNGNALTNAVNTASGFTVSTVGEPIWVADEVTARLKPTGGNAIFGIFGNEAGEDLSDDVNDVVLGPTNLATVPYNQGAILQSSTADFNEVRNNLIAVARLAGNVVQIMPLQNKVDGSRDVIKVRPEATITLGSTSKAQGVRLVATVTGNNIAGSKVIEVARIRAAGSSEADIAVSSLPASGDMDSLLTENGDDASSLRAPLLLSSVNTTNTSISALVPQGSVLDDTLPSFFCGGTAGTVTNGPNSVPQQPFARAIVVEESTAKEFDNVLDGGGNDVVRFTLPVGIDLFKISTTPSSNDVSVISTDAGSAGTFAASPAVVAYETISDQAGGQAFIDVSFGAAVTGADTVKKAIALIFGAQSLVIPEGQADFDVEVSIVIDDGTDSTANDVIVDVLGTAPLATGCSEQFTVAYCDDALANFGITSGPVESDMIANGSELTSFEAPDFTIRLLNTETTAFPIPDICVTENVADAAFVGSTNTTPNIFGPGNNISIAINNPEDGATASVAFANAGGIRVSDDSVTASAPSIGGGLINTTLTAGTGTDAFLEMTTFRFNGITLNKTASNFQPTSQSFTVFSNDGTDHIATTLPAAFEKRGSNGTAFSTTISGFEEETINLFFNGDDIANNTATPFADSGDFTNGGFLTTAFANTNSPIMSKAVRLINDTASTFDTLSDETKLSIAVDEIDAVTNGLAAYTRITVFTSAGELEPGSLISVQSPVDLVTVPVNSNGNFTARLRGEQGDTLVLTQTPTSDRSTEDQVVVVNAENQNLEPTLLSAVAQNFAEIGTITQQGTAPVLFKLTAVGRVDGEVFIPTASDLRVGATDPVYAVPGTTDMFLAIVDFRKTDGNVVSAPNIEGSPSVVITSMDTDFPTFNKQSRPILRSVNQRTKKNGDTRVVFKGKRLRNAGVGYLVLDDGTVEEVTFRKRTGNDRSKNRVVSEGTDTVPANTLFGVFHVPGRGISTIDLSGN